MSPNLARPGLFRRSFLRLLVAGFATNPVEMLWFHSSLDAEIITELLDNGTAAKIMEEKAAGDRGTVCLTNICELHRRQQKQ